MKNKNVILGCAFLTFGIGTVAHIYHSSDHSLPPFRFFVGNGVLFTALSFLGEINEEIANALSIAVVTFVLVGEERNRTVFAHFMTGDGKEANTGPKRHGGPLPTNQDTEAIDSHGGAFVPAREGVPNTVEPLAMVGLKPLVIPGMASDDLSYAHYRGN